MATLDARTAVRQIQIASDEDPTRPVRVVDMFGNEFDVFQIVASSVHGGEIRICVEPKNPEG